MDKNNGVIYFRNLSAWLKLLVIFGWIMVLNWVFWFGVGFIEGFIQARLGI